MAIEVDADLLIAAVPFASFLASWVGTVVGNRVDIKWIKEQLVAIDAKITRAHERIDNIHSKGVNHAEES